MEHDGTGAIWVGPKYNAPLFTSLALQLGEFLYQLRAALDASVYRAAIIDSKTNPPPNEGQLLFPICTSPAEFKNASAKIRPLNKKRREIIEAVQPYLVPNIAPELIVHNINRNLGILHDWARKDRHRKLHIVGSFPASASPKIRGLTDGVTLEYMRVINPGFLENESQVAAFKLSGYMRGMRTMEANPDLMLEIAINEPPPPCAENDTFGERMAEMVNATYSVVVAIEDSF